MGQLRVTFPHDHEFSEIIYGLDFSPFPGFFMTIFGQPSEPHGEHNILEAYDTRPHMTLGSNPVTGSEPCSRRVIVDRMLQIPEIPREHIDAILHDRSPHPEQDRR